MSTLNVTAYTHEPSSVVAEASQLEAKGSVHPGVPEREPPKSTSSNMYKSPAPELPKSQKILSLSQVYEKSIGAVPETSLEKSKTIISQALATVDKTCVSTDLVGSLESSAFNLIAEPTTGEYT